MCGQCTGLRRPAIFAVALSQPTHADAHVYRSDPGRAVHMRPITNGCRMLQEGEGDFMLAFPSSVKAVMFCLKVRPGPAHAFPVLSRLEQKSDCHACCQQTDQWCLLSVLFRHDARRAHAEARATFRRKAVSLLCKAGPLSRAGWAAGSASSTGRGVGPGGASTAGVRGQPRRPGESFAS